MPHECDACIFQSRCGGAASQTRISHGRPAATKATDLAILAVFAQVEVSDSSNLKTLALGIFDRALEGLPPKVVAVAAFDEQIAILYTGGRLTRWSRQSAPFVTPFQTQTTEVR